MKIAFVSDTHGTRPEVSPADLLIHCGDICPRGAKTDFLVQLGWLHSIRAKFPKGMFLCPGNHDIIIEEEPDWAKETAKKAGVTILIDEPLEMDGIKFYFSPWTLRFYDWAYMKGEKDLMPYWAAIPDNTQVLVTHGPAKYFLDGNRRGDHCGSHTLGIRTHQLTNLEVHAFGHIHEGYGTKRVDKNGGYFWAVNASSLNGDYQGFNPPHVVDTETWDVISDSPEPESRAQLP